MVYLCLNKINVNEHIEQSQFNGTHADGLEQQATDVIADIQVVCQVITNYTDVIVFKYARPGFSMFATIAQNHVQPVNRCDWVNMILGDRSDYMETRPTWVYTRLYLVKLFTKHA